jgi:hypothetical protein
MRLPGAGPLVEGMRVPDIMFADDVKLIAESPGDLQSLLDALHLFCVLFDMQVNVSPQKTCIVVYQPRCNRQRARHVWKLGDQEVPQCEEYTDLGVRCTATQGMGSAHTLLAQAGRRAMHALLSVCRKHRITQPDLKLRLYNVMVDPALSYASQVWGPWLFHGKLQTPLGIPAESVHIDFLRIMAGVGRKVKHELLLHDFQRHPVMWRWVSLAVRLWEKLSDPEEAGKLSATALRGDVKLMLQGCRDCWSFKLLDTLSDIGVLERTAWQPQQLSCPTVTAVLNLNFTEKQVKKVLQERWVAQLTSHRPTQQGADAVSHQAPADAVMMQTYMAWVRAWDAQRAPRHLTCTKLTFKQLQCISRMRLGWHNLEIQQGRHRGLLRRSRVCVLCMLHGYMDPRYECWPDDDHTTQVGAEVQVPGPAVEPLDDLLHHLVECRILEPVRCMEQFKPLFYPEVLRRPDTSTAARHIMNYPDQVLLADALYALQRRRLQCLDQARRGILDTRDMEMPVDPVLRRQVAFEAYDEAPAAVKLQHQWY